MEIFNNVMNRIYTGGYTKKMYRKALFADVLVNVCNETLLQMISRRYQVRLQTDRAFHGNEKDFVFHILV